MKKKGKKYKITVKRRFGPYSDQKTAYKKQARIKKNIKAVSLSKIVKSRDGYRFTAAKTYIMTFDKSSAELKRSLVNLIKKDSLNATVSVQPV